MAVVKAPDMNTGDAVARRTSEPQTDLNAAESGKKGSARMYGDQNQKQDQGTETTNMRLSDKLRQRGWGRDIVSGGTADQAANLERIISEQATELEVLKGRLSVARSRYVEIAGVALGLRRQVDQYERGLAMMNEVAEVLAKQGVEADERATVLADMLGEAVSAGVNNEVEARLAARRASR